jgi:hypothetical protein
VSEVILRKRFARAGEVGLFPVDDDGLDVLARIKHDRDVGCDVIQRRNPRHHRLYWAIVCFLQMHAPRFENASRDQIHVAVKLATGLVDTYVDQVTGEVSLVPRSIAWAAMDQSEFAPWFDDACRVVANRWMPAGTTPDVVRAELIEMVDGPRAAVLGSKIA